MISRPVRQPSGRLRLGPPPALWAELAAALSPWRPLCLTLGLAVALALADRTSTVSVALTVDGRTETVASHAGTVAELLAERAVAIHPGDLVVPGPHERIGPGTRVVLQRARRARVRVDGRVVPLRRHGGSVYALLRAAGVDLAAHDAVTVNGEPRSLLGALPDRAEEWVVEVWRAMPVTVVEDGVPFATVIAGPTVAAALTASGVPVYAADALWPPAEARLEGVTRITIERATPFVVQGDGRTRAVRALASTVGEGLEAVGIGLRGHDYAIPPADTLLRPGLSVQVVRVEEDILVQDVDIPYGTETEPDPAMALDETRLVRPGELGVKRQRIRITYEDGQETGRETIDEEVLRQPVAELIAYGTRIVWGTVDTPEGPKAYWRRLRVYATSYSLSRSGTPATARWYGLTRTGMPMRKGIIAVDPRIIALHTNLYVPGYGLGIAGDTGGGIRRYHIDLGFDDDNYESWHWYTDVYLLEPLPGADRIPWILP